jgi:hypothetical protein
MTDPDEWAAAGEEFGRARADFYEAARRDLGIAGELPTAEPPEWLAARRRRGAHDPSLPPAEPAGN